MFVPHVAVHTAFGTDPSFGASITGYGSAEEFLQRVESIAAPPAVAERRVQQVEARQNYWQYGLLLMMAALVAESFVGRS